MGTKRIALIIPAYNEEEFIGETLNSLLNQSYAIDKIIVVDDVSDDDTALVVSTFLENNPSIQLIKKSDKEQRASGAKIVRTFKYGLQHLDISEYHFIGKVDSDLIFPKNYIETIINKYNSDDKLALVGGMCQVIKNDNWVDELVSKNDHVRGALKIYRKEAFEKMGGLEEMMGWDSLDEYKLRYNGYKIEMLPALKVKHLRPTNRSSKWMVIEKKHGTMFYQQRFGFFLAFVSCMKRGLLHKPFLISGIYAFSSYLWCSLKFKGDRVDKDLGKFIRDYRYRKIFN